jgi:hypothetical protein
LLSGPGQYRRSSTPSLSGSRTATGLPTPVTPSKRFQTGIDPKEVSKALHKLKDRIGHSKETKEAKYVQAKSDLASRRTLALFLTYTLMLYGAPSHRLEEYILALFKVCGLDGRVNYIVSVSIFSGSCFSLPHLLLSLVSNCYRSVLRLPLHILRLTLEDLKAAGCSFL